METKKNLPQGIRQKGHKFYARAFIGRDECGKAKYVEKAFPTIREAKAFRAAMLLDKENGKLVQKTKETVRSFCLKFLEEKARVVREGTLRKYKSDIKTYIIPELGHKGLQSLTPTDVKAMYKRLESRISDQSIKHIHVLLKQILKEACIQHKLAVNPLTEIKPPKPQRQEMKTWTKEEASKFLQSARTHRYYLFFSLALATGMRCGEILALRWRDITIAPDSSSAVLRVQRSWTHGEKGYTLVGPKTQRGYRSIDLPNWVIKDLLKHRSQQEQERNTASSRWEENDLVICTQVGTPVLPHNIRMIHNKLIQQCGVPRIRIHDLRHTHATLLLSQNVHPHVVQQRLGHEDVSTTLQIYSHVLPSMQQEAAQKIDALLSS
ncbi:tyrosine-type recombinase/integrase [Alicyclobacillus acidoterrestris]|uniref:Site-specific integrase n=1 Tax=Alicyclobacillus acidoterrestris (strain ATCC 49025 / DSM 3922 / CIP 106132 / NCIMB 13137 / GD3B) TaxID=1356854 RepID=T0DT21_ALIAG|nr:site-specific integrase [Alicyclobacillus acidoterrestris]EPZ52611.1 hypothetical protein N007_20220 [Alicyclobacillus acidoterrestris ATCC 49025]UNO49044.1 site-specific integrase [Alicyclobacillus acidoterrestris]